MINFMRDDFSEGGSPLAEDGGRGLLLGIGQAGIQILDQIVMRGGAKASGFELMAIDADQAIVDGSVVAEKRLLGKPLLRGLGSFGDRARARAVWKLERESLLDRLSVVDQLVIVAGLGGGTGTTLAMEVAQAFRNRPRGGRVIVVATQPFSFESDARRAAAQEALSVLRAHADAVLSFSNDRAEAWPDAPDNIRRGLHGMNLSLAQGVESVAQILAAGGFNPLTFADLRGLFGRLEGAARPENCWIGRADSEPHDDALSLVERALSGPLVASGGAWEEADRCLACLVGGADFSVSQLQAVSKAIEARLPAHIAVSLGTRTAERFEGRLSLTLVLAATRAREIEEAALSEEEAAPQALIQEVVLPLDSDVLAPVPKPLHASAVEEQLELVDEAAPVEAEVLPEPELAAAAPEPEPKRKAVPVPVADLARPAKVRRGSKAVKQEELPFEAANSGRFENSFETIHKGENLDQPTFRRRRLVIQA
ncbi:MAG: hypothetical protein PW734_06285 [Verrucomicrobium sp.]|nr:hypothetical protein [Verrucomicrobium sp.]